MGPSLRAAGISGAVALVGLSILLLLSPGYLLYPSGWIETVALAPVPCPPTGPINLTPEGTFPFHTVTFRFYIQAGACHLPGVLNWTGTESNGKSYGSEFTYQSAPSVLTWRSPDGKFGVQQILYSNPPNRNVTLTVYE
jgi:hypothetical protein